MIKIDSIKDLEEVLSLTGYGSDGFFVHNTGEVTCYSCLLDEIDEIKNDIVNFPNLAVNCFESFCNVDYYDKDEVTEESNVITCNCCNKLINVY